MSRRLIFPLLVLLVAALLYVFDDSRPSGASRQDLTPHPRHLVSGASLEGEDGGGRAKLVPPPETEESGGGGDTAAAEPVAHRLRVRFSGSTEAVEGARCRVSGTELFGAEEAGRGGLARIHHGAVDFELLPGDYQLLLGESPGEELSRFTMPAADFELRVELGGRRKLRGRITVGGRPMPRALISLELPGGAATGSAVTDKNGVWRLDFQPDRELGMQVRVSDPWFSGPPFRDRIPRGESEHDFELPSAVLALSAADPTRLAHAHLYAVRAPLPGEDPGSPPEAVEVPPPSEGPVDLRVRPGSWTFRLDLPGTALRDRHLELHDGEVRAWELRLIALGRLRVLVDGEGGSWAASGFHLEPADAEGSWRPWSGAELLPGELRPPVELSPGAWELRLRGPLVEGDRSPPRLLGADGAEWETSFTVHSDQETVLRLRLDGESGGGFLPTGDR